MNKQQEQGFFNQIEEVLQAHEETYELGAWEEFDANRKKNKRKWPIFGWTAAAVVLLCVGFGLFEIAKRDNLHSDRVLTKNLNKPSKLKIDIPVRKNQQVTIHQPLEEDLVITQGSEKILATPNVNRNNLAIAGEKPVSIVQDDQIIAVGKPGQQPENAVVTPIVIPGEKIVLQKDTKVTDSGFENINKHAPVLAGDYDSLVNRNRVTATVEKNNSKLTYSLVVSPSLSNQKINFGAGMELSYSLGNRLSINSGLMYTALNAKSDGKSLVATNSKPQSANLALSGIELPLGIQYQMDGGFYATAGVSALGLINDKLEYDFLQENTVSSTVVSGGQPHEVLKVVAQRKTEKSIEPLNNYMGFFNFSAGKKQAFGNVNLNIGPFVKVPFSSVSSEKIKLLQGGIKISVDF